MNILHLLSTPTAGISRTALDLCTRLVEDEHSVAVISRGVEAVDAPFKAAGIPMAKLPLRGAFDLVTPISLAKVLNRMAAPIVVHAHCLRDAATALRARRLMREPAKVRVVWTHHSAAPAGKGRALQRTCAEVDAFIFPSEAARSAFMASAPAADQSRLHLVPAAIRPSKAAATPRSESSEEITLVYIGPISRAAGLEVLIRALGKLTDRPLRLRIAGTGKAAEVMPIVRMTRTPELKDRVEWLGLVDNPVQLIDSAHLGLVSADSAETPAMEILEFMSRGVPVIATTSGATPEIITDGADGLLVAPGNADALAAAIRRAATDTKLRKALSDGALRTADRRYDYDDFYWKILKIYEQ
ncbi:MAG: glycosyltransferase family 4 protein [Bacteroidales bacterium]|nr:glycosyltransferase family 4 protein [Bacteroidales bacterium]